VPENEQTRTELLLGRLNSGTQFGIAEFTIGSERIRLDSDGHSYAGKGTR
jgi:hypothetical protein